MKTILMLIFLLSFGAAFAKPLSQSLGNADQECGCEIGNDLCIKRCGSLTNPNSGGGSNSGTGGCCTTMEKQEILLPK